jgi:hypothetical protein
MLNNQGTVEGYGTIARNGASGSFTFTNARTLQPGSSTTGGLLSVADGNLSQTAAAAVLKLLLGDPGTLSYGRIAVTDSTTNGDFDVDLSNGSLDFSLLGSFTPAPHTAYTWDLITAPTIFFHPALDAPAEADARAALYGTGGGAVRIDLIGTAGSGQILRLTAIPEPAAMAGVALLGFLCARPRRRRGMVC